MTLLCVLQMLAKASVFLFTILIPLIPKAAMVP